MPFSKGRKNLLFLVMGGLFWSLVFSFFTIPVFGRNENFDSLCDSMEEIENHCQMLSRADCQRLLENCVEYYDEKSAQIEKDIIKTEQEKKSLRNQIDILKKKIQKLEFQIQQSNMMIKDLSFQIQDTEKSINQTSLKIKDSEKQLSSILRIIYEEDKKSLLEILFTEKTLSGFFDNVMKLEVLNLKNKELLENIKALKTSLEDQRKKLDEEKEEIERILHLQTLQKKESEDMKKEKDYLLKMTEKQYQEYLREKEETKKRVAEIKARIFELVGVAKAPTFGEAYEIAKWVESITGVRPAFLLAVLTQESNIGKNVGQCYLKNPQTGEGIRITTGERVKNVMKPNRDIQPFLQITKELGRDPYNTPVSCPIPSVGGYGGAMGPAQFIPSTWLKYRERVSQVTGKYADPWSIKDSFLAAALYLADFGATKKTYQAEWQAAMIYFSGTTSKKYKFYGDSVMRIAQNYTEDIKELEKMAYLFRTVKFF